MTFFFSCDFTHYFNQVFADTISLDLLDAWAKQKIVSKLYSLKKYKEKESLVISCVQREKCQQYFNYVLLVNFLGAKGCDQET